MRFLFTLNMPPGTSERNSGDRHPRLVHQIIGDHDSGSCQALCEVMNDNPFIAVRQWYYDNDHENREKLWIDRGFIIINTHHIGKVVEHFMQGSPDAKRVATYERTKRDY
jgi:hypothetical protein